MKIIQIKNTDNHLVTPLSVRNCDSFFCRLKGLMFKFTLKRDCGLLLIQSNESRINSAIHMFFVFFDLAIIWLNSERRVVDKVIAHRWPPVYFPRDPACYILEIHPSRFTDFNQGDRLEFNE